MTITVSLIDALLMLLIIFAIVLLYQLIVLIRNLIPSVKSMAKIMDDTSVITGAAKVGAEDVVGIVSNLSGSVSEVMGILHGNKSRISAITNLTNTLTNLVALVRSRKK